MSFDLHPVMIETVVHTYVVDCQSLEEFDESLKGLKHLWDLREKPYAPSSGPRFFHYFVQYQADVVRYHMRKDLR